MFRMKNRKTIIILSISIIIFITVVTGLIWWVISIFSLPDENKIENTFNNDLELLETVVCYLENSGYESVYVHKTMFDYGIEDKEAVKAIKQIFRRGYDVVAKSDNIIYFLRWTRFKDFGSGFVFSVDGVEPNYGVDPKNPLYGSEASPTQIMFLTKLEPLSESNWYYYEEDFNEWRIRYG